MSLRDEAFRAGELASKKNRLGHKSFLRYSNLIDALLKWIGPRASFGLNHLSSDAMSDQELFRIEGSWFHGADVDRLSLEEAREIAETVVAPATKDRLVSVEEATQIKSKIEAYFRKELVKFRTRQEQFSR